MPPPGKDQGFTIIELLIVVIIIAILTSVTLPVLSMVRQKVHQITCCNNLRQLSIALAQYAHDNNSLLPPSNNSGKSKDQLKNCGAEVWFKAVDHYLISSAIPGKRDEISIEQRLTAVKQDPVFRTVPLSEQHKTRTLKMNMNLTQKSECQRSIETIGKPAKTVLLFDGRINNSGVANNFEGSYGSVAQRHSKAANILFIDGHVECIRNGDSDGTTGDGWPDPHAGQELIWDPDKPDLP
ncbi:MAG: prepilin-type N-terminal cleavage/methylation domain-containing protein [Candidatus Loosdrechtia sp.]|uniref:prepilin-type N-terminal cleavage/methylation domain-containing protein n=1 Tax=Candidatus Loosdrechtia sp. TaxID=3101272 RepID=UPI003A6D3A58|nr:MAG: prepilin-type N-terminal cleavage/methylation domain-containing protein [Candidatus Jettenia sp. AMX2]